MSDPDLGRRSRLLPRLPRGMACDAVVIAYALWTITAHAVVIARGTARALTLAGMGTAALSLVALAIGLRSAQLSTAYLRDLRQDPVATPRQLRPRALLVLLSLPALTLLAWLTTRDPWTTWIGVALSASVAAWLSLGEPLSTAGEETPQPEAGLLATVGLYLLALGCAVLTLLAVRPRADDTFYLNIAQSVIDHPQQPILRVINIHGPPTDLLGPQPMFPPYFVHSFELLGGVIGKLSGIAPVEVIHFGFATALAWLTPFAIARLVRIIAPRHDLLAVCAAVAFYWVEGSASRGYANHAFVRLFNGKAALLTIAVPLICAYGLRYGSRPTRIRWLLLALAQIAAVGLSSTGLWLAPTLAMISVVAGAPSLRTLPARALGSFASSGYVLVLGLWIMSQMGGGGPVGPDQVADTSEAAAVVAQVTPRFAQIAEAISIVLGSQRTAIGLLGVALLAGPLAPSVIGFRLFAGLALAVSIGFANPFLAEPVARHLVGVSTYQRVLWLLPVAIGTGTCCVSLFTWLRARWPAVVSSLLVAAALTGFLAAITTRFVLSGKNQTVLKFPPVLKLPPHSLHVAREVCKRAPAGTYVLGSQSLSQQLPVLPRCGYPVIAFDRWMVGPVDDKQDRAALVHYVSKRDDLPLERASWFVQALARYHPDVVVLTRDGRRNATVESLLRASAYLRVQQIDSDDVYARARSAPRPELDAVVGAACRVLSHDARVLAPFELAEALDRRGCGRVQTTLARVVSAQPRDLKELLELERVTSRVVPPSKGAAARLSSGLTRRDVNAVLVAPPALANGVLTRTLGDLGFTAARAALPALLYARAPAPSVDGNAPAPAPP
ncbi:MAG: DUF6077 domain-containing protein [Polyangiales bacterium]